jgi:hypothetical protein
VSSFVDVKEERPVEGSRHTSRWAGSGRRVAQVCLAAMCLLSASRATNAQSLVTPSRIDRTIFRANARAVGMGGTYLLVIDDASAGAFNPALLANAGRYSISIQGGARSENIPVDTINRITDSLDDFRDAIGSGSANLDNLRAELNRLYEAAVDAGARIGEARGGTIAAELDPLVAFSYRNVGALVYGGISVNVAASIGEGTGPNADKRTLAIGAGVLDLAIIEVPYAFRLKPGYMGVGLKSIRGSYAGYIIGADASNNSLTGVRLNRQDSRKFDMDLGFISDPIPIKGLPGPGIRAAGVIRHLFAPTFSVPLESTTVIGPDPGLPSNADFRLNPQIDLGAMAPYKRLLGVLELHNLSATNAGELTVHLGAEYQLARWVTLRAGLDHDRFVGGVGFMTGPVRLDVAVATDPIKRVYAGLSVRM